MSPAINPIENNQQSLLITFLALRDNLIRRVPCTIHLHPYDIQQKNISEVPNRMEIKSCKTLSDRNTVNFADSDSVYLELSCTSNEDRGKDSLVDNLMSLCERWPSRIFAEFELLFG